MFGVYFIANICSVNVKPGLKIIVINIAIKEVRRLQINIAKMKQIFTIILTIIVSILVVLAIYANKSRFFTIETEKYTCITVDEKTNIQKIIEVYSDQENKERFISELIKVNNLPGLSEEEVYGRTIYIPLISN